MQRNKQVYGFIYRNKVVTSEELSHYVREEFGWSYQYLRRKYLSKMIMDGRVMRIRNGLYAARNPYETDEALPSKYLVGSKVRDDYYLGYHTALELLGAGHSVNNGCYIAISKGSYFRPFKLGPLHFQGVQTRDLQTGSITLSMNFGDVKLSNPSRTFVEALHRPELAGGYEESIQSLEGLGGVELKDILKVLDLYDNGTLDRKVGFLLEQFSNNSPYYSGFTENDLDAIEKRIGSGFLYIDRSLPSKLAKRWKLYVPQFLIDYFEEGL